MTRSGIFLPQHDDPDDDFPDREDWKHLIGVAIVTALVTELVTWGIEELKEYVKSLDS